MVAAAAEDHAALNDDMDLDLDDDFAQDSNALYLAPPAPLFWHLPVFPFAP